MWATGVERSTLGASSCRFVIIARHSSTTQSFAFMDIYDDEPGGARQMLTAPPDSPFGLSDLAATRGLIATGQNSLPDGRAKRELLWCRERFRATAFSPSVSPSRSSSRRRHRSAPVFSTDRGRCRRRRQRTYGSRVVQALLRNDEFSMPRVDVRLRHIADVGACAKSDADDPADGPRHRHHVLRFRHRRGQDWHGERVLARGQRRCPQRFLG